MRTKNKVKDKNSKQYRKLLGADGEAFKFQMLPDIIVQGESTKARDLSSSIKYPTTQEPDKYFKDLKEMAQNMTRDELQQKIKEALASLPDTYREAFILHRFGNKSYKEIAELLQVSPKTVDYRIQQALKQLRILLKDYSPLLIWLIGETTLPV